jgi:hypothetical protein
MATSERRAELLVAGKVRDGSGDVAACGCSTDEEAFAWVGAE